MMKELYYSKLYKPKSSKLKYHVCLITYLSLCMNFLKHPFSRHPVNPLPPKPFSTYIYIYSHITYIHMIHDLYIPMEYMCFMTFDTNTIMNAFVNSFKKYLARRNAPIITSFIRFTHCW